LASQELLLEYAFQADQNNGALPAANVIDFPELNLAVSLSITAGFSGKEFAFGSEVENFSSYMKRDSFHYFPLPGKIKADTNHPGLIH